MVSSGKYITQPTGYKAFIPSPMPEELDLSKEILRLLGNAEKALDRLDGVAELLPNVDYILAMFVRKESLLSSQIEGTQASLDDLFSYEGKMPIQNEKEVEEVVNYIKAMKLGIRRLEEFPMSLRIIKEVHKTLMSGCRGSERTPGEFRTSQNWIGGHNLTTASFIPPPPHEAIKALGDLELYLHRNTSLPELIKCALVHYQYETIHPFLDGNGRSGRLLITFYLLWKKAIQKPLLYLSYYFKINRQEYYDRLTLVREKGDYMQWIFFFLKGVIESAQSALKTTQLILRLNEKYQRLLIRKKVASPNAIALLHLLLHKPHLSIHEAAEKLDVSFPTADSLIREFEDLNILKEITQQKRNKRYIYWEYLNILSEGTEPI
jgi:Fic family protein